MYLFWSYFLQAQDTYDQLKTQYDRLRKEEKHDSALVVAKQMSAWALKNETDTSLRYAVSLRYVGNCFDKLQIGDSTLFYWDNSLAILEKQNRSESIDAARCYHNKGIFFSAKNDNINTIKNYEISIEIKKKAVGEEHPDYASSLNNLGILYRNMGDYKAAEPYYKQALEIRRKVLGEEHPDYAGSLISLGILFSDMGDYKAAEPYYKQALEIRKKALGEEHPDYAGSLNNLGILYKNMGDYKAAEPYDKQSLEIYKKVLGEEHPDYASSLNNLGILYYEMGDYKAAEPYYKQSLEIYKKVLGEEHPDYASSLNNLGILYKNMGDYKAAEPYYKRALEIRKKALGEEHPDYAGSLISLGILFSDMGDYKAAEPYYKRALEIRKKALGEEHPDYAGSLISLGILFSDKGDYKAAEPYYKQSLEIYKKALGEEHPDYAGSLICLGILYYEMGDYKAAEPYYKQSLEIYKKVLGEEHPDYASSLNNLGILYKNMGDYKAAEPYCKQALEIRKKALGEEHPDYASSLNNLGILFSDMGDYKAAEPYYKQALEIRKKALGEEHLDYASSLNNLGILYYEMGDYKAAEPYYKQSLEIYKKALGEEHPDYASSLNNLGILYRNMGDYKAAEPYYKQALEIYKKVFGEEHDRYASTENSYAYFLAKTNRKKEGYEILKNNFTKKSIQIADNFEWLNDNQKEAYWKKESSFYDNLSWFANEAFEKVPEAVGLNYNAALVTKSKMLEAKISSENYYREVDELREELAYRRRLLAKMESDGSSEKDKLEKLRNEADSLDKRLTLSWPEYAQQKKNLSITWDQVQQNLEKGEAAIEFVRFKNEEDSFIYYNALVFKKGDRNPILIKLCREEDLTAITPKIGYSAYYPIIWQPLESALVGIKTIYYAPSGELYNVPFHALYAPKGKGDEVLAAKTDKRGVIIQNEKATTEQNANYLMDRYTLHQLTSTRYLAMGIKQKEKEKIGNNIAMVGGVNYDYLLGTQIASKKTKKNKNASRSSESAFGKLAYLEGTKTEVEQIASSVTQNNWQATLLENNDATEEKIIKLENKEAKSILHIATHGYAFPEYDFKDTTISKNSLRYSYRYSTNPMVRSGLILAGGNWAWTGSDTLTKLGAEQNGILTALEVSQLNLKKTKLVVLSACETGLGKIEGSEGIFGLKRGFKLAGVEQMIVSLWSVPDKETMELMTLFYSDLTKSLNPVSSFEKAQKEMRNKYPTDPEKWAGFVLVR
jgi:tetratricopeptide (TPR) repeat protein/CHAT domain-containing protein